MRLLLCLFVALHAPNVCHAWSPCIQGVISLAAVDGLSDQERTAFFDLLRHHPQYEEMIARPKGSDPTYREDHIIIGAGSWADRIEGTEHDRPNWHYLPMLVDLDGKVVRGDQPEIGLKPPAEATLATQELNLVQAFKLCRDVLLDEALGDAQRAVALCWVMNLIGDLHHPLHVGSLYAPPTFPAPLGDRHGRLIFIDEGTFHEYIEGIRGEVLAPGDIRRLKETWETDQLWQLIINSGFSRLEQGTYSYLEDTELILLMACTKVLYSQFDDAIDVAARRGEIAPLKLDRRVGSAEYYEWLVRVRVVEAASELRLLLEKSL